MHSKIIAIVIGAISVIIPLIFILKRTDRIKSILIILAICFIDLDHFVFTNQAGFLQVPKNCVKIFHAFHTIEFLVFVLIINLITGNFKTGIKNWLFPNKKDYSNNLQFNILWGLRIIFIGTCLHYFMDLFIYTIMGKWSFYDYSIIHYLLS